MKEFKKTLEQNEVLDKFDRYVFESIVEKVIVGGLDENGNVDPAQLTFVYKTGLKNSVDGAKFKPQRKNARGRHRTDELCSHDSNEVDKMCSDSSNDTRRNRLSLGSEKSVTHINFDVDVEEMLQDKRGLATYGQIKAYVLEHTGLKVSSLYIAQVNKKKSRLACFFMHSIATILCYQSFLNRT